MWDGMSSGDTLINTAKISAELYLMPKSNVQCGSGMKCLSTAHKTKARAIQPPPYRESLLLTFSAKVSCVPSKLPAISPTKHEVDDCPEALSGAAGGQGIHHCASGTVS
jgi:hypothetical protein